MARRKLDEIESRPAVTDETPYTANGIDPIPEPEHPSPRSKLVNYLVGAALGVVAIVIGLMLFWAIADEEVLKVNNAPFPVRTIREHPTANGVVILNVDLCKNTGIHGQVRTSFVGESREVFLPLAEESIPKGCLKKEIPVLIPEGTPAGTYKIKFRATYDLNPLKRNIVSEFESKEFVVDPVIR